MVRLARWLPLLALSALTSPSRTALGQTVLGYQLGVVQSAGGTFGDNQNPLLDANPNAALVPIQQVQGLQLNTLLTANLTLDIVTSTLQHGFLLGVQGSQLLPFAVPEDAQATLRERLNTFTANAAYVARIQEAAWGLTFGAGYTFGLNGRIQNGANGTVDPGLNTTPAAGAGAFLFNGQSHAVNAQVQYQLNRTRWDLQLGTVYNYTANGIFTLAAGGLGAQGAAGAIGTNLGAFIPANVHTFTPQFRYRQRIGARGQLTLGGSTALSVPLETPDDITVDANGTTTIVNAPQLIPPTIVNTLNVEYLYNANQERSYGVAAIGNFGLRVPTDGQAIPIPGTGLRPDTVIWTGQVLFRDMLPWQTRIAASAGVAQATLLLPPLGANGDLEAYEPVRSNLEPVFNVGLQRRFEPVEAQFQIGRTVGVGAFGASAVVSDAAALTFTHVTEGELPITTNVGFNAQRTAAVGQELFRGVAADDPIVVAFNNRGFGANVGIAMPLWREDPLAFDISATYNFTYNDLDPGGTLGFEPIRQHLALLTIRGTYGRGAAQQAVGAGGRRNTDELDAFSANPRDGSPLVTQRLLTQGAPLLEQGRRPGQPAEQRADSRQVYQETIRQEALEKEARERSDAVQGVGSYAEEEERKQKEAKEKQERAKEDRTREFGEWPMDSVSLPDGPAPKAPPPAAETKADEPPPPPPPPKKKKKRRRRGR